MGKKSPRIITISRKIYTPLVIKIYRVFKFTIFRHTKKQRPTGDNKTKMYRWRVEFETWECSMTCPYSSLYMEGFNETCMISQVFKSTFNTRRKKNWKKNIWLGFLEWSIQENSPLDFYTVRELECWKYWFIRNKITRVFFFLNIYK